MAGDSTRTVPRILAGLLALGPTAYAVLVLAALLRHGVDLFSVILAGTTGTAAALLWWYAWKGHDPAARSRMRWTFAGGFVVGGIAFAAGFLGPILVTPEANQGPLLGIFITGPLGFVLGAAIGWLYARWRERRAGPAGRT